MMRKTWFCFLMAVALLVLWAPSTHAQASLAGEDSLDVAVGDEHVTCIRDAIKTKQWYYVPSRIRLAEFTDKAGKTWPVFSLVKYQAIDPKDPQRLLDGGVLQFSVNLSLPNKSIDTIKAEIAKAAKMAASEVMLAPLPMTDAKLTVYGPGGDKLGDAPQTPDVAPTFANQAIPVQINLNALTVDLAETLCTKGGGIMVSMAFDYQGLTPKCGFKVKCDLERASSHYSSDSQSKSNWNNWYRTWWGRHYYGGGGNSQQSVQTLREDLTKSGSLTVERIEGPEFKDQDMDKYIDPVLEKMQAEMFEVEAPEKIDAAKAKEPTTTGNWWYSSGSSLAIKDIKKSKKTNLEFNMSKRSLVTRKTSCGGVISLSPYLTGDADKDKEIRARMIAIMPAYNWSSAFYSLPDLGDTSKLAAAGITEISIQVMIVDKAGTQVKGVKQEMAKVTRTDGYAWKDANGNPRTTLAFALAGAFDAYKDKVKELQYKQTWKISFDPGKGTTINQNLTAAVFDGGAAVSTPLSAVQLIELNGDNLTFYGKKYEADNDLIPADKWNTSSDLKLVKLVVKNTSVKGKTITANVTLSKQGSGFVVIDKGGLDVPTLEGTLTFESAKFKKEIKYPSMIEDGNDLLFVTDSDLLNQ